MYFKNLPLAHDLLALDGDIRQREQLRMEQIERGGCIDLDTLERLVLPLNRNFKPPTTTSAGRGTGAGNALTFDSHVQTQPPRFASDSDTAAPKKNTLLKAKLASDSRWRVVELHWLADCAGADSRAANRLPRDGASSPPVRSPGHCCSRNVGRR